jgi:hypothetical protein
MKIDTAHPRVHLLPNVPFGGTDDSSFRRKTASPEPKSWQFNSPK